METTGGDFQFDVWARLAADDPQAFENARQQIIDRLIAAAPEPHRRRLRGLQWQVDRTRERSTSALSSCAKISKLMWEKLLGDGGLVQQLERLSQARELPAKPVRQATLVPFPTRN